MKKLCTPPGTMKHSQPLAGVWLLGGPPRSVPFTPLLTYSVLTKIATIQLTGMPQDKRQDSEMFPHALLQRHSVSLACVWMCQMTSDAHMKTRKYTFGHKQFCSKKGYAALKEPIQITNTRTYQEIGFTDRHNPNPDFMNQILHPIYEHCTTYSALLSLR